mgnify:CR=1 FL=1
MTATSTGCGWAPGASAGGALHPALLDAWDSAAAMGEGVVIALLVVTEWKMFRAPDFEAIKTSLKHPVILDGRNMYDPAWLRELGFDYQAIGR